MDFDFSPEDEAFRDEVRAFLAEQLPPPAQRGPDFMQGWLRAVREKRYVGFSSTTSSRTPASIRSTACSSTCAISSTSRGRTILSP